MPITPEARHRLAELMDARRRELRLRWQDVAEAGGLSLKTLHSVRTGSSSVAPLTERGIEAGLQWERGSVGLIYAGGDPVPAPEAALSALDTKDEPGLVRYLAEVEAEIAQARKKYPAGPTGAQVFPDDDTEAGWWDAGPGLLTQKQLTRLVAVTRRLSDQRGGGQNRRTGLAPPGRRVAR